MRPRKIDDKKLLEMFNANVPQKEIARQLNVSEPAISKRLRKLLPPPDLSGLTDKQAAFSLEVAKGNNPTASALKVYDCKDRNSAKVLASNLLKDEDVNKSIAELMRFNGFGRPYRLKRLKHWIDHPDGNFSLRALDQSWKLDGSYNQDDKAQNWPTRIVLAVQVGNNQSEEIVMENLNQPSEENIGNEDNEND